MPSASRALAMARKSKNVAPGTLWGAFGPYLTQSKTRLAGMAVGSFVSGIAEACMLVVVARLAVSIGDVGEGDLALGPLNDIDLSVGQLFLVAISLAVARTLFQVVAAHLGAAIARDLVVSIRSATFGDYTRASWSVQADEDEATVQDLLGRHVNRTTSAVGLLAQTMGSAFSLLALVISAFVIDPLAAGLIIVAGVALFVLLRPLTVVAKRMSLQQMEAGRRFAQKGFEAVALSLEIRAFGVGQEVADSLDETARAEARPVYYSNFLNRMVTTAYQTVAISVLLVALFVVHEFVDRPLASLGAVVVVLVRSLNMAGNVQGFYHSLSESVPFAIKLHEERERFRAAVPAQGDVHITVASSLVFDGVGYRYPTGAVGLDDVSFRIEPGEAVGLIGPSGSGKSTLIQVLLRLREANEGSYRIGDVDALTVDDEDWFDNVAFVPQDCRVFNGTIADNIRFYRDDISLEEVQAAARKAHLHDEIAAMADGYATVLGPRGGALSGGQRQRVAIARALLRKPAILVLDEPTSALDMRSESLVHDTFTELRGEVTSIVIAHRLSTLNTCDRIMVMGNGKLQAMGTRAELDRDNAFYREALALSKIRS